MDQHRGIVYLAENTDADPPFTGYWENGQPPAMLEDGPGWTSAAEAVRWGRERALVVLLQRRGAAPARRGPACLAG
jgi:hypothetical protein